MKFFYFFLLTSLLALSCGPKDPYQFEEASSIEIKKDPCFGFCPVYTFKVNGKGKAFFDGVRNVSKEGNWERQLNPDETNELFDAFAQGKIWDFEDEYTSQVTDLPTTWVTFILGTKSKTVKDYYGAPEDLKALEKMVELIAETDEGWTKVH